MYEAGSSNRSHQFPLISALPRLSVRESNITAPIPCKSTFIAFSWLFVHLLEKKVEWYRSWSGGEQNMHWTIQNNIVMIGGHNSASLNENSVFLHFLLELYLNALQFCDIFHFFGDEISFVWRSDFYRTNDCGRPTDRLSLFHWSLCWEPCKGCLPSV